MLFKSKFSDLSNNLHSSKNNFVVIVNKFIRNPIEQVVIKLGYVFVYSKFAFMIS